MSEDMQRTKELLRTMLAGWCIHDAEGELTTAEDAMIRACDGDKLKGELLCLFGHWSNDVLSIAAHYGLALARRQPDGSLLHEDGTLDTLLMGGVLAVVQIDPAPSPEHYWSAGAWQAPHVEPDTTTESC